MKKILGILSLCFLGTFANAQQHIHNDRCGANYVRERAKAQDPDMELRRAEIERKSQEWIQAYQENPSLHRSVVNIPVVIHVVYNTSDQNVSDAQIQSQIDALNRDYRKTNSDISQVPAEFSALTADVEFEFCLADTDPNGQATTGITRTSTNVAQIGNGYDIHYTADGGHDAWDTDSYVNIWVCEITSAGDILGYASFPGSTSAAEDGIVIDYRFFGTTGTATAPMDEGRTATHEVGHYFNLEHIWGVNGGCGDDDLVSDTPDQLQDYYGCPTHPQVSCSTNDMFMNYMDYVDDGCMVMFTEGQKTRMLAALNTARPGLLTSNACSGNVSSVYQLDKSADFNFEVYPNPAQNVLNIHLNDLSIQTGVVSIFDVTGKKVFENQVDVNERLNVEALSDGIYFVRLKADNKVNTVKVRLQR